jgi:hypothetical protein
MLVKVVDVTGRVRVVDGATAVTVRAVTPMREHADENLTRPEQGDAYAGMPSDTARFAGATLAVTVADETTVEVAWTTVVEVS